MESNNQEAKCNASYTCIFVAEALCGLIKLIRVMLNSYLNNPLVYSSLVEVEENLKNSIHLLNETSTVINKS